MKYMNTYSSPFSWRYGTQEMRSLFSETHKYTIWRSLWLALAKAQYSAGLVSKEEYEDLVAHNKNIDINRILTIEEETKHDVMASVKEYAEKATIGGGKIHYGATSMDIVDNTDHIRMIQGLDLIEKKLIVLIKEFANLTREYKDLPCMAYTHLQPAEPTTLGYRFAGYTQDLLTDLSFLQYVKKTIKAKGLKGAVGTSASYVSILEDTELSAMDLEKSVMDELNIESDLIATQVYSRKYDYMVLSCLASVSSSLAKFGADIRMLQTPQILELSEPFGDKQIGSSAMPFKRNPIMSEKICSLARFVSQLPVIALENATHSYLERTLDDSANKRIIIPEAFLAVDEILKTATKLIKGLNIHTNNIEANLQKYGQFSAMESILMKAVHNGADRQEMHEVLRTISSVAWESMQTGTPVSVKDLIMKNETILSFLEPNVIEQCMNTKNHIGNVSVRIEMLLKKVEAIV